MPRRSSTPAVSSAALDTLTLGTLTRIVPRATVEQVLRRHQRMHKIGEIQGQVMYFSNTGTGYVFLAKCAILLPGGNRICRALHA